MPQTHPATVLVVDDDADIRAIVRQALAPRGHILLDADDGDTAQRICRETHPDLVITDIMMPRMNGIEFVRWFRAELPTPFVPVLMLTALGSVDNRIEGLEVGADDYLVKPFNYRELQARVQSLLRIRALTNDLYDHAEELEAANKQLAAMQAELVQKERELVTAQLAGAAAHTLGQPVTSILLNLAIVKRGLAANTSGGVTPPSVATAHDAVKAIEHECEIIHSIVGKLRAANPAKLKDYLGKIQILDLESDS